MKVNLLIHGIRHNVPEEGRDLFYNTIIGKELRIELEPSNPRNKMAMAAIYNGDIIGHISENTLQKAWACFNSKPQKRMWMKVVDVDRVMNSLKVCYHVYYGKYKEMPINCCDNFDEWDYDGPMLGITQDMFELDSNSDLLLDELTALTEWNNEMEGCFNSIIRKLHIDKSKEIQERLFDILGILSNSDNWKLREKAKSLQLAINHSNNDESRLKTWDYIKNNIVSNTFIERVRLWYDKSHIKQSIMKLPQTFKETFRNPADVLGLAAYQFLPRERYMKLLSFVAAMEVINEYQGINSKNIQIFKDGSNNIINNH